MTTMALHGILMLLIGTLELALGVYILVHRANTRALRWYGWFVISAAAWVLGNAGAALVDELVWKQQLFELAYVTSSLIATTFLLFTYYFPYQRRSITRRGIVLLFTPSALIFLAFIVADPFIASLSIRGDQIIEVLGSLQYPFTFMFLAYWLTALIVLARSYIREDGTNKRTLKYLLSGVLISSVLAIGIDLILPILNEVVYDRELLFPGQDWLGSELSVVWFGYTSYIVFKKAG